MRFRQSKYGIRSSCVTVYRLIVFDWYTLRTHVSAARERDVQRAGKRTQEDTILLVLSKETKCTAIHGGFYVVEKRLYWWFCRSFVKTSVRIFTIGFVRKRFNRKHCFYFLYFTARVYYYFHRYSVRYVHSFDVINTRFRAEKSPFLWNEILSKEPVKFMYLWSWF